MDNPAVATFCRESLRNCLMIMGRDAFKAEVEYMLHCYAVAAPSSAATPTIEPSQEAHVAAPEARPTKWARKPVPEDKRCKRSLPYNGGQCTFKALDGKDFCSRHNS